LNHTALILIDLQNDYFPGGRMELEGSVEASFKAKALLDSFRQKRLPTVHIQHVSVRPGASFFLPNTDGLLIHESVKPLPGEVILQKNYPNSFRGTPLMTHLEGEGVQRLVICGAMTHMCVDSTVRAAFDYGFECLVAGDACATKALKFGDEIIPAKSVHSAYLAALGSTFAKVATTDDVLKQLT
jgi:nicotinamidase-related amidase